jgi:hypothetical protein
MSTNNDTKIPSRLLGFLGVVMFLFGGTAGYIVRDVRADVQVLRAADQARENAQALATEALQRGQVAAETMSSGVRAAAESTAAAVQRLANKPDKPDRPDSAVGTTAHVPSALSTKTEKPAEPQKQPRAKR